MKRKKSLSLPIFAYALFALFVFSVAVYVTATLSSGFADFWTRYPGALVRGFLAHLTNIFPFSLVEVMLILLPVFSIITIILILVGKFDKIKKPISFFISAISCISLFFSLFALGFGTGYHTSSLESKLSLECSEISKEELAETARLLADLTNEASEEVDFEPSSFSIMPYSLSELNKKLLSAYDALSDEYDFIARLSSRIKPVMLSKPMSYTHITGVYTYFSGEANLNVNFPDYTLPFTAAHELAHQRGIAREDEANFIAFLVCIKSDDPYIRYSGLLNMYEYVAYPLSSYSELYTPVAKSLNEKVKYELIAYSEFFNEYRHSSVGKVSESINNSYLQSVGTEGTKSYGMVVDLAVAYLKNNFLR